MANCDKKRKTNSLDPIDFDDPNIENGVSCDSADGYPFCDSTINICLCNTTIEPPPAPEEAKCVNDIIKRPWPPPPPANPGCNPFSVSVSSEQNINVTPEENIRLEGEVNYVGNDPCLPELNLKLLVNPDFRSGGAAPIPRGWGIGIYGVPQNNLRLARITPDNTCSEYNSPQEYLAKEPGAEHFIPVPTMDCNTNLTDNALCLYRQQWADKVAQYGLIGPRLMQITESSVIASVSLSRQVNGQTTNTLVPYAWEYQLVPVSGVKAGGAVRNANSGPNSGNSQCAGLPFGPFQGGTNNVLIGLNPSTFKAYNIKENLGSGLPRILHPGVNLQNAWESGLSPQPIEAGTQVFVYGWVPWGSITNNFDRCECPIVWFFDVPNALAGECLTDSTQGLTSMIPTRTVRSAGMFFGGLDATRI